MSVVDLMVPIFLAFREGIEAVLVIVIILLYLKNTDQRFYYKYIYIGATLAIISSIIFAIVFTALFGGFSGSAEQIFEGVAFIISGIFVATLVLWMSKEGPKMKKHLEEKVEFSIESGRVLSLVILTYIIIIREGIELILLLTGATSVGSLNQVDVILGSITGLGISVGLGLLIYYGVKNINLSKFFKVTNVILILFVAGLITYGIHELIEAGVVNPIIQEVWNIKHILPETFPDGNPLTPEWLEVIGSLLKALFGYNANPSLLEIIIYPSILILVGIISLKLWKRTNSILVMEIEQEKQAKLSLD
ncbi:MAG: FTR1 family protein [Candidatus Lokiarchaeota archaeon]|nr:FTR1 family protein [Candidatus Lokiarchaeota archaeon]